MNSRSGVLFSTEGSQLSVIARSVSDEAIQTSFASLDCFARARNDPGANLSPQRALRVHIERVDRLARSHEQPVALQAAEAEIGAALGQCDAAYQLAVGRVDHDAVEFGIAHAPAAPQIAVDVASHAVRC